MKNLAEKRVLLKHRQSMVIKDSIIDSKFQNKEPIYDTIMVPEKYKTVEKLTENLNNLRRQSKIILPEISGQIVLANLKTKLFDYSTDQNGQKINPITLQSPRMKMQDSFKKQKNVSPKADKTNISYLIQRMGSKFGAKNNKHQNFQQIMNNWKEKSQSLSVNESFQSTQSDESELSQEENTQFLKGNNNVEIFRNYDKNQFQAQGQNSGKRAKNISHSMMQSYHYGLQNSDDQQSDINQQYSAQRNLKNLTHRKAKYEIFGQNKSASAQIAYNENIMGDINQSPYYKNFVTDRQQKIDSYFELFQDNKYNTYKNNKSLPSLDQYLTHRNSMRGENQFVQKKRDSRKSKSLQNIKVETLYTQESDNSSQKSRILYDSLTKSPDTFIRWKDQDHSMTKRKSYDQSNLFTASDLQSQKSNTLQSIDEYCSDFQNQSPSKKPTNQKQAKKLLSNQDINKVFNFASGMKAISNLSKQKLIYEKINQKRQQLKNIQPQQEQRSALGLLNESNIEKNLNVQ